MWVGQMNCYQLWWMFGLVMMNWSMLTILRRNRLMHLGAAWPPVRESTIASQSEQQMLVLHQQAQAERIGDVNVRRCCSHRYVETPACVTAL
jgi:hypothetical protein